MNRRLLGLMICMALLLVACGEKKDTPDNPTPAPSPSPTDAAPTPLPTIEIVAVPTQTPGGPTVTPSRTVPPTITPTVSPTDSPPTETPTATGTPGPYEHVVQAGEECIPIAMEYGHVDLGVIAEIERLNGISCRALPLGETILVPRPTATATPPGLDMTQTVVATSAPPMVTMAAGPSYSLQPYVVQDGDTLASIAIMADSSMRQICEINPLPNGINCSGCTFEQPNCCCPNPPVLSIGQTINIPAPPPTPTYTPTFTGSEPPTATPTHPAPRVVFPPDGATVAGQVRLAWLTSGVLAADEYYMVLVIDETTGQQFSTTTRQLSYDIPLDYLPDNGQALTFAWQVTVGWIGEDGLFYPSGAATPQQRFTWLGWSS